MSENNGKQSVVLIAAGGTGGHIFPAFAVADRLKKQGVAVHWIGSGNSMESKIIPSKFPFHAMQIRGLRQKGWRSWVMAPFKILRATQQAYQTIRATKADTLLVMGGFVSGPAGLAAKLARKRLVIHEQNSIAGLTNRCLAPFATVLLRAFPSAFPGNKHAQTVGNPLRASFLNTLAPSARFANRTPPLKLLVVGGSQGAHFINAHVLLALEQLSDIPLDITHQTGQKDLEKVKAGYEKFPQIKATVLPFIDDVANAYLAADLVIARAGALTVSELAAIGVGSFLIPYPFAVDNHQFTNAAFLANAHAAFIMEEKNFDLGRFVAEITDLANHREKLLDLAQAARSKACLDATEKVARACLST